MAVETALTTVLFEGGSGSLMVNADARRGEVRVELLDEGGRVIRGYGKEDSALLRSDRLEQLVQWKSQEAVPAGAGR